MQLIFGRVAGLHGRETLISPTGLENLIVTEKVYWSWFAIRAEQEEDLAVVVAKCVNEQWEILDCKVESAPMSMQQAEAQAMEKNLAAFKRGEHVFCNENQGQKPQDAVTRELQELRVRLDALEQRLDKLEQDEQRRHDGT
jgi:hypothetical protein